MLNQKLIIAIVIAVTVGGAAMLVSQIWMDGGVLVWILGSILFLLGATMLYFWWRMNQLAGVSNAMMAGDFNLARTKLGDIRKPDRLNRYSKTYYYLFLGTIEARAGNLKPARQALKTSLEVNSFRALDEKASAYFMLAQVELQARNREGARRYLIDAKELGPSDELRKQINQLAKQANVRL